MTLLNGYENSLSDPTLQVRYRFDDNAASQAVLHERFITDTDKFGDMETYSGNTSTLYSASTGLAYEDWLAGYLEVAQSNIISTQAQVDRADVGGNAAISQCCWVEKAYTGSSSATLWGEYFQSGSLFHRGFRVLVIDNKLRIQLYDTGNTKFKDYCSTATGLGDGNPHHIAVTWDSASDTLIGYLDGSPITVDTGHGDYLDDSGDVVDSNIYLSFNGASNRSASVNAGAFADFRYYSKVLSATEVSAIYSGMEPESARPRLTVDPTTKKTIAQHISGPGLNIATQTPFGLQNEDGDISDALQWAVDNQHRSDPATRLDWQGNPAPGGPAGCFQPFLPANTRGSAWRYLRTLYIPYRETGSLRGAGYSYAQHGTTNFSVSGTVTRLFYDVAGSTSPAIVYQSADWEFSDFCLIGREYLSSADRPHFGIASTQCKTAQTGYHPYYNATRDNINDKSTTGLNLSRVNIGGFEVCWENGRDREEQGVRGNGNNTTEHSAFLPPYGDFTPPTGNWNSSWNEGATNCDFMKWRSGAVEDCLAGFRNLNDQGQAHEFTDVRFDSYDIGFDFWAGGAIRITDYFSFHPTPTAFTRLGPRVGKNTGMFVLRQGKFDRQAGSSYYVLEMDDTNADLLVTRNIHVVLEDGIHTGFVSNVTEPEKFIKLVGGSHCTVARWYGFGPFDVTSGESGGVTYKPAISLDDCRLTKAQAADPTTLLSDDTQATIQVRSRDNSQSTADSTNSNQAAGFAATVPATLSTADVEGTVNQKLASLRFPSGAGVVRAD